MSPNDPYAKLGGGALDQELFKKHTPLSSTDPSDKAIKSPTPESPPPARQQNSKKANKSATNDVMTSALGRPNRPICPAHFLGLPNLA